MSQKKGKTFAYFWEKNVIHVNRENIQESTGACRVDGVTSGIGLSPGVGPSSKASLGNQVKNRLVRVVFTEKGKKILLMCTPLEKMGQSKKLY